LGEVALNGEIGGANWPSRPSLRDHNFGGFDHNPNRVALLQLQLFGATARDHAFHKVVTDLNDHLRHNAADLHLFHNARKLISSRKSHTSPRTRNNTNLPAHQDG